MGPMGDWPWYGGNFGTIVPNFPKEKALSSKPKTFSHKYTYGVAVVPKMYRTALQGPTSSQDGHSLPKLILEALIKVLSAYLKH